MGYGQHNAEEYFVQGYILFQCRERHWAMRNLAGFNGGQAAHAVWFQCRERHWAMRNATSRYQFTDSVATVSMPRTALGYAQLLYLRILFICNM